jgi:pilus assembly protein Flp/PilA
MWNRLINDCDGQDMVEYAMLIAIVALGAVAALGAFQNVVSTVWQAIGNNLSGSGS